MIARVLLVLVLLFVVATPGPALAANMGWSEAVTRLAAERAKGIACARLLKKLGGETLIANGAIAYADAKAEIDGLISGLVVAIAQEDDPESLPDLEARLTRGVQARLSFCALVEPLVQRDPNEKNFFKDLMANTIAPAIEALKELYLNYRSEQALMIKTIQTQLEGARWPDYSKIKAEG